MLAVLLLSGLLAGCGTEPSEPPEEPEQTPETVFGYTASFQKVSAGLSSLVPLCASKDGFFCVSTEKTGEAIPENVIRQARLRNRKPYNDGRYDLLAPQLWHLDSKGAATALEAYTPLPPEENPDGWRGFSCETGVEALAPGAGETLYSLEFNAVSGNSAPLQRIQQIIGKNYREYRVIWHLRTLGADGAVQEDKVIEGGREAALAALAERASKTAPRQLSLAEVPFSVAEVGIDSGSICSPVVQRGDGSWCFLTGTDGAEELVTVTYGELNQKREPLILASDDASPVLEEAVASFNRAHPETPVTVISFDEAAAGQEADLFCLTADVCRSMAKAGLLADLYPFLDADKGLKRANFFPNILEALEVDGGLYCTCAGVSFETVVGASSLVGEKAGWTYDDFLQAWSRLGIGTDAFDGFTTSADILRGCLKADLPQFFDREGRTCAFTGEGFTRLLYFTGNFPRTVDLSSHPFTEADAADLRIRRNKQMLLEKTLCNMTDALYCGCEFPEEVTFIGYPSLQGTGNVMTVSTLGSGVNLSMSSACGQKDAAWQFLRTFFTESYQSRYWYFPTNINAFNRQLTEAMKVEYAVDDKGKTVTDRTTGEPVKRSLDTMYLSNYTPVNIYPLTESQAEKLVDLMRSTTKLKVSEEDVLTLVVQHAAGFWAGTSTLEEAAQQVQAAVEQSLAAFAPEA